MAFTERQFKISIRQHIEPTMRQYVVLICKLIDTNKDVLLSEPDYIIEFSFNLEYLMTEVDEMHRGWFIAHAAHGIIDPIVEEKGWIITEEENDYIALLDRCAFLWEDYEKNLD